MGISVKSVNMNFSASTPLKNITVPVPSQEYLAFRDCPFWVVFGDQFCNFNFHLYIRLL